MKYKKNYGIRLKKGAPMGAPMTPVGIKAISLADHWKERTKAYEGIIRRADEVCIDRLTSNILHEADFWKESK